ncbi:hypothetical protein B7494_g996 [Chlorociboria aeruginascens]|nr:hypothetical protein B7494_g996 [Chlorociboria aeruginascens]
MTSYFSSLLTTTTSRVASIRQNLLPSENDGDTEDDTHLCRVLRAYYIEKGKPFPGWLPPDPKAPPPVILQLVDTTNVGAGYGGLASTPGGGTGLSSLWDSQPQPQQAPVQQSLRGQNRLGAAGQNPFTRNQTTQDSLQVQARPLPSQRAGSYQTNGPFGRGAADSPAPSSASSAQERLKSRFMKGSRGPSTPNSTVGAGYESRGGGGGNYEDGFMATGDGAEKPFVAATSPWASSQEQFGGQVYGNEGYDTSSRDERRGEERGPGLPSGPRRLR